MSMQQTDSMVYPSCSDQETIQTPVGALVLHQDCPLSLVERLCADKGLRAFARHPEREHHRLVELARRPDTMLTLASTLSGEIIGEVSLTPAGAWWQGLEHTYEIAVQVSSYWRRLGIARRLLASAFSLDVQEERVILGMGLSWHWDVTALGITSFQYRALIEGFFANYGFCEYLTLEPNICMDPANIFLARIGSRVSRKVMNQFLDYSLVDTSGAKYNQAINER